MILSSIRVSGLILNISVREINGKCKRYQYILSCAKIKEKIYISIKCYHLHYVIPFLVDLMLLLFFSVLAVLVGAVVDKDEI